MVKFWGDRRGVSKKTTPGVVFGTLYGSNDRFAKWFARLGLDGLAPNSTLHSLQERTKPNKETIPLWWYCDLNVWDENIAPFTDLTQWINANLVTVE